MSNPIYQQMNNNMVENFRRFQQTFRGDPQAMVQQMLQSGRISQTQYNNAVQMAQQLQQMLGK